MIENMFKKRHIYLGNDIPLNHCWSWRNSHSWFVAQVPVSIPRKQVGLSGVSSATRITPQDSCLRHDRQKQPSQDQNHILTLRFAMVPWSSWFSWVLLFLLLFTRGSPVLMVVSVGPGSCWLSQSGNLFDPLHSRIWWHRHSFGGGLCLKCLFDPKRSLSSTFFDPAASWFNHLSPVHLLPAQLRDTSVVFVFEHDVAG